MPNCPRCGYPGRRPRGRCPFCGDPPPTRTGRRVRPRMLLAVALALAAAALLYLLW